MTTQPYDVFLCHNSDDKNLVEQLSERLLEEVGVRAWLDAWAIPGGANWEAEIEQALAACSTCAVILGEHGWGEYHLREARLALARKQRQPSFPVIPLLLPGARAEDTAVLSDFFQSIQWVDFRKGLDDDEAFRRLVAAIRGETPFPEGRPHLSIYVIRRDARRWEQSRRKDKSILYRGRVLQEAQRIAHEQPKGLTDTALTFLTVSASEQRKSRRRLLIGLAAALIVTIILSLLAWNRQQAALIAEATQTAEFERAETEARRTLSGELARRAVEALEAYPQRSLLLAVEAVGTNLRADEPPVAAAEDALRNVLAETGGRGLSGHTDALTAIALSSDQRWLVTGSQDQTARLWDLTAADPGAAPIVLHGHKGAVTSAAISPDNHWLATGSGDRPWQETYNGTDNVALLWDLTAQGFAESPIPLKDHTGAIETLAISPDSHWLATGSADNTARIWDLTAADPSARPLVLRGHTGWIWAIAFSADSRWLVTAGRDATARVWDLTASDPSAAPLVLHGHKADVQAVALSRDKHWLLTGSGDNTGLLWDLTATDPNEEPLALAGHTAPVWAVALSPDNHWAATGSWDHTARLWDLTAPGLSTAEPMVLLGHKTAVFAAEFTNDSRWLVTSSGRDLFCGGIVGCPQDNTIRRWDLTSADPSATATILRGHESFVPVIALSDDNRLLASGSADHTARLWHLADPAASPLVLPGHFGIGINDAAMSADNQWLATAGDDNTVRVWDLTAPDPTVAPIILQDHDFGVNAVAISPDNHWLASGDGDNVARLWDLTQIRGSQEPLVLGGHQPNSGVSSGGISALVMSGDGHWLATGSEDATVRLWDLTVANPSSASTLFAGHERGITAVAISADNRWLAAGSFDNITRLWDLTAPNPTTTAIALNGHTEGINGIQAVDFSPDNQWLVTAGSWPETVPLLWDLTTATPATRTVILSGHDDAVTAVAFSPDSHWLATASDDMTVRLWDLTVSDPAADPIVLHGHEGPISAVAFSPDNRLLITSGGIKRASSPIDTSVRLWNLADLSAAPVVLRGHAESINALAISADSRWLATVSLDDTARLWPLALDTLIDLACRTAGRNLTGEEWEEFFPGEMPRPICDGYPFEP